MVTVPAVCPFGLVGVQRNWCHSGCHLSLGPYKLPVTIAAQPHRLRPLPPPQGLRYQSTPFLINHSSLTNTSYPFQTESTSLSFTSALEIEMCHGLPQITVPLPSRAEPCLFTLRPVTHTVGDFLNMLRCEDAGIDRAIVRTTQVSSYPDDENFQGQQTRALQGLKGLFLRQ